MININSDKMNPIQLKIYLKGLKNKNKRYLKYRSVLEANAVKEFKKETKNKIYAMLEKDYTFIEDSIGKKRRLIYMPSKDSSKMEKMSNELIDIFLTNGYLVETEGKNMVINADGYDFFNDYNSVYKHNAKPHFYIEKKLNEASQNDSKFKELSEASQQYFAELEYINNRDRRLIEEKYILKYKKLLAKKDLLDFISFTESIIDLDENAKLDQVATHTKLSKFAIKRIYKKAYLEEYASISSTTGAYIMTIRGLCFYNDLKSVQEGNAPTNICDREMAIRKEERAARQFHRPVNFLCYFYPKEVEAIRAFQAMNDV